MNDWRQLTAAEARAVRMPELFRQAYFDRLRVAVASMIGEANRRVATDGSKDGPESFDIREGADPLFEQIIVMTTTRGRTYSRVIDLRLESVH